VVLKNDNTPDAEVRRSGTTTPANSAITADASD
jgi:hypothetical protein